MPIVPTIDRPLNMPCDDPEGCKHFKAEMQQAEQIKEIEDELNWWHELINKHHKNRTCPDLKTYVENLQKRITELEIENKALRISEQDSHLKAKEYFSESANAKQALAIARETIQSQADRIKELEAELTRLRNIINAKRR